MVPNAGRPPLYSRLDGYCEHTHLCPPHGRGGPPPWIPNAKYDISIYINRGPKIPPKTPKKKLLTFVHFIFSGLPQGGPYPGPPLGGVPGGVPPRLPLPPPPPPPGGVGGPPGTPQKALLGAAGGLFFDARGGPPPGGKVVKGLAMPG